MLLTVPRPKQYVTPAACNHDRSTTAAPAKALLKIATNDQLVVIGDFKAYIFQLFILAFRQPGRDNFDFNEYLAKATGTIKRRFDVDMRMDEAFDVQ
jgi:hypothetical protein